MTKLFKSTALALAASSVIVTAVPAEARHNYNNGRYSQYSAYNNGYNGYNNAYSAEPVYANTRVWQGRDGSYYCQKKNGTTGLIVGAAAGALLGRAVDRSGDRTLGTVIGAAAGALLGKRVEQGSSSSCR